MQKPEGIPLVRTSIDRLQTTTSLILRVVRHDTQNPQLCAMQGLEPPQSLSRNKPLPYKSFPSRTKTNHLLNIYVGLSSLKQQFVFYASAFKSPYLFQHRSSWNSPSTVKHQNARSSVLSLIFEIQSPVALHTSVESNSSMHRSSVAVVQRNI